MTFDGSLLSALKPLTSHEIGALHKDISLQTTNVVLNVPPPLTLSTVLYIRC
jgi:hypothetical protein